MGLLSGKTVLITGASRGIGLAIAERFAREGASLFLAVRDKATGTALAERLSAEHAISCSALACDVADADSVKMLFKALFALTRRLDVLINNAGMLDEGLLGMLTSRQIEHSFACNAHSVLFCSQYAVRMMQRAGGGSIINLTSIMATQGAAGLSLYSGSKAAVIGITRSLAQELAGQQIRVNAIAPGFIDTDMTRQMPEAAYQQRLASVALGRIGAPDDVAQAALFLASDMSAYITGQVIGVDGGMQL